MSQDTEPSTAIVKSKPDGDGKEGFDESNIIYADNEVPFGPLGVFPENYSDLQAKVRRARAHSHENAPTGWRVPTEDPHAVL